MVPARSISRALASFWDGRRSLYFFRNVAAAGLALIACLVPEVGPNRFWLAALLLFVCIPAATFVELRVSVEESAWAQPLLDLGMMLALVQLVPQMWVPALVIGIILVQAPSIAEARSSSAFHALFAVLLTVGMALTAVVHDVPDWELPILSMVVLYPSVIFYSYRQARRANELRERAQAVDGLHLVAGGVAHDFNNVLTGVMGQAEILGIEIGDEHPAAGTVDGVVEGLERASLLAARLLAFSGHDNSGEQDLDLHTEVEALVGLMETVVPTGVELELDSALRGAAVRGQRVSLHQVVMNLILNAAESEPPPRRVRVDLDRAGGPRGGHRGRWLRLRVIDDGDGIHADLRDRIFDPFFTLKTQGSGLGLANVRSSVQELNGQIEVDSEEGRGTCMTVYLPEAVTVDASRPSEGSGKRQVGGGRALVVDDEETVRRALVALLRECGYESTEARDGYEAIERLRAHRDEISVVLLDIRMPGMGGWQCLRELRRIRRDLPVLVCSGHDPYDEREHGEDEQVAFLPKPVRLAELRRALDERAEKLASSTARAS